jgi:hypothetical protein
MSSQEMKEALQVLPATIKELAVYSRTAPRRHPLVQVMPDDPGAVARELFAVLRAFDARGVKVIWVEQPHDTPDWEGVRRLQRAPRIEARVDEMVRNGPRNDGVVSRPACAAVAAVGVAGLVRWRYHGSAPAAADDLIGGTVGNPTACAMASTG